MNHPIQCILLILATLTLSSCASKPFEWEVTGHEACKKHSLDDRQCAIDTATPNDRTIHCLGSGNGWVRRMNKFYWSGAGIKSRPALPDMINCKAFNRNKVLVEGEYALGGGLAVVGDVCKPQPQIVVLTTKKNIPPTPVLKNINNKNLAWEPRRTTDHLYDFYVARNNPPYMKGNTLHQSLNGIAAIIKKQCAFAPDTIYITGAIEANPFRSKKKYTRETVYEGKMVKDGNSYVLIHEDKELAEQYQILSLKTLQAKIDRSEKAKSEKRMKELKAQQGLALILGFGLAAQGIDICKSGSQEMVALAREFSLCKD